MVEEIKTLDERKKKLLEIGKKQGYITYEQLANSLKGLEIEAEDLDELYISAIQNPLYRNVLKKCDRYILHAMGETEKTETVFTRYEFEKQLNCLKDFLKNRD